jgi:magnesium-transporting ATPase (P-type)
VRRRRSTRNPTRAATTTRPEVDGGPWHTRPAADVAAELRTDARAGLDADDADRRLAEHGPNRLPEEEREHPLLRFLKHFHNVLIYILLAAAGFTALLGEWIDFGVIVAVVVVNAAIGYVQEGRAERALAAIRDMLAPEATVRRGGRRERIAAEALVPGDLVLLESGARVPADLRLTRARNARIDEAALTGESVPVSKQPDPVRADAPLGDRRSMAYSGTLVVSGSLEGLVVGTGEATELGRIGELVTGVTRISTPLLQKIARFGRLLSLVILALSAALFAVGWLLRDYGVEELLLIVVSFAVAAIPEGLPAILTITLALAVRRMAGRNAIVRRLPAVETLGSVTVICSDKTGTLTLNEMTVQRLLTAQRDVEVSGVGYEAAGELRADGVALEAGGREPVAAMCRAALLCNDASTAFDADTGAWSREGDPMEGALVVLAAKAGLDPDEERSAHPRLDDVPFASEQRYMATLHETPTDARAVYLKGAPERVLELCERVRGEGGTEALDAAAWHARIDAMAADGLRALALATKDVGEEHDSLVESDVEHGGFTLLGVAGLMDPPRPEAIEAVSICRRAGIRVKMITGDHAGTARSIAARLGIGDGERVTTGREIDAADDDALVDLVRDHDVVARSSPEHKLRLVQALQRVGEVTAMTGDGVNDAPALKQADIGVAMGITGSDAAKGAAEMVLADDNFASIERAVEEGRTVYDNLRKTILFLLPTNGAEALMVIVAVAFAFAALPMTPVQILWVNMVTAVTLGLALAFEPPEPGVMDRPPRPRAEPILSRYMLWRIAFVSALVAGVCLFLFLRALAGGADPELARTLAVNALVVAELCYLFNARFMLEPSLTRAGLLGNRQALGAAGLLIVLQLVFTYVPLFHRWFGTRPLAAADWILVAGAGALVFFVVELEKMVARRRAGRGGRRATPAPDPA